MAEEKETGKETEKKNWFKSLFTDREWDADASKIVGFALVVAGCVGFFMAKENFQWLIAFGAGLLGWKAKVEGV